MKVVIYIRAEDERWLKENVLHDDVPTWVRNVVRRAIQVTKERHERADAGRV